MNYVESINFVINHCLTSEPDQNFIAKPLNLLSLSKYNSSSLFYKKGIEFLIPLHVGNALNAIQRGFSDFYYIRPIYVDIQPTGYCCSTHVYLVMTHQIDHAVTARIKEAVQQLLTKISHFKLSLVTDPKKNDLISVENEDKTVIFSHQIDLIADLFNERVLNNYEDDRQIKIYEAKCYASGYPIFYKNCAQGHCYDSCRINLLFTNDCIKKEDKEKLAKELIQKTLINLRDIKENQVIFDEIKWKNTKRSDP